MAVANNLKGAVYAYRNGERIKILEIGSDGNITYCLGEAERLEIAQAAVNNSCRMLSRE